MGWDADLSKLVDLCFHVIESEKGKALQSGSEWKNDGQILGTKIFRHVASAQQVGVGLAFDYGDRQRFVHIDHSSVAVIVRAAIEAFLAFNYIFANDDERLSIYRHKLWERSGLIERSKLLANTEESKEVLRREALIIERLHGEITSSPFFLQENRDSRKEIEKGAWRPNGGWYAITRDSSIHQKYFNDIYSHLSGHSHASYISALQIRDAAERLQDQKMLADGARQMLCLVLAHFLFSYVKVFPDSKRVLQANVELFDLAICWHVQKEDVKHIYG